MADDRQIVADTCEAVADAPLPGKRDCDHGSVRALERNSDFARITGQRTSGTTATTGRNFLAGTSESDSTQHWKPGPTACETTTPQTNRRGDADTDTATALHRAPRGVLGRRRFVGALTGIACATVFGFSRRAFADGVTIAAELDRHKVQVGEGVRLIIEVASEGRGSGSLPEPKLPDFASMGISFRGPSTRQGSSHSWVNGQVTSRITASYTYALMPSKPGSFQLPVSVNVGGKVVQASPVSVLEVVGEAVVDTPVTPAPEGNPTKADGDVFMWVRVDNPEPYVGEQLTYTIEVYERSRRQLDLTLPSLPGFQDFWTEDLPTARQRSEMVDGAPFTVHTVLKRALFPQKAGALTIAAPQADVGVRTGIFGQVRRLRRVTGQALEITVKPLPAEGQPVGFSPNNVGSFGIKAEVDRTEVDGGEPLTLTITVSGSGNLAVIDPGPWPDLDGLRRYDPKTTNTPLRSLKIGGSRTYEFLLIPEKAGELTIPPHTLDFFHPAKGRYERRSTKPIKITVTGAPPPPKGEAEGASASDPTSPSDGEDDGLLAGMLTPPSVDRVEKHRRFLTADRWTYGMFGVPLAFVTAAVGRVLWNRLGPDEQTRARAARNSRKRELLAQAQAQVSSGEGFYASVGKLLQSIAVDRAGPEGSGLPRRELLDLLARRGVTSDDLNHLGELLDRCDAARFGATAKDSTATRQELFDRAQQLARKSSLSREGTSA